MKIRNGFVSNSSSSSFILVGFKRDLEDVENEDLENREYWCIGKYLEEGSDIFRIKDSDIFREVKKCGYEFEVWESLQVEFDNEMILNKNLLNYINENEILKIYAGERCYHSAENYRDIVEHYKEWYLNEN